MNSSSEEKETGSEQASATNVANADLTDTTGDAPEPNTPEPGTPEPGTPEPNAIQLVPSTTDLENLDPNDFDHEFDDDFEAEVPGEYELADDEYARALLDIVDFEIEGLEMYRDDDE